MACEVAERSLCSSCGSCAFMKTAASEAATSLNSRSIGGVFSTSLSMISVHRAPLSFQTSWFEALNWFLASIDVATVMCRLFGVRTRWGCLIATGASIAIFCKQRCRVHGCLRGRHRSPHDGASQHEPSMWLTHSAETAMQPHQRNGSAHVPAGTPSSAQLMSAIRYYAVTPAVGLKNSPVFSMVCMMTASFRATATAALLKPILSRS